jgi:hypothetical protein
MKTLHLDFPFEVEPKAVYYMHDADRFGRFPAEIDGPFSSSPVLQADEFQRSFNHKNVRALSQHELYFVAYLDMQATSQKLLYPSR